MPTMHRLGDLPKKKVLCLLHNAHLDFFKDNMEHGLDGKALKARANISSPPRPLVRVDARSLTTLTTTAGDNGVDDVDNVMCPVPLTCAAQKIQTHGHVQAVCPHLCRIQRNKLLREISRWVRDGVQAEEYEDRGKVFAQAITPVLEVKEIIADLHARATEVGVCAQLLDSPRARQLQMRRRGIGCVGAVQRDRTGEARRDAVVSLDAVLRCVRACVRACVCVRGV
jgi:hypothetical protein